MTSKNNSKFVVVTFLEDKTTSEVPVSWIEGDDKCWWPSAKDIISLISKRVTPNKNSKKWNLFDVEVDKYFDSIEAARNRAAYFSSDEEEINLNRSMGRSCRKKKPLQKHTFDASASSEDESLGTFRLIPKPPSLPKIVESDCYLDTDKMIDQCVSEMPSSAQNVVDQCVSEMPSSAQKTIDQSEPIYVANEDFSLMDLNLTQNILVDAKDLNEIKTLIKESHQKLLYKINKLQITVNELNERAVNDNGQIQSNENEGFLQMNQYSGWLPLNSIEKLMEFEIIIIDVEQRAKLVKFFIKIGGNSSKELINRILKKSFSNQLSAISTWLGQRNNFKVKDKNITKAVQEAAMIAFPNTKEHEFEEVCAEWFRQGKQRLKRESTVLQDNVI